MTACRASKVLSGVAAAAVLVSCQSGTGNPLLSDPMADVKLDQAKRISRTVTDPSTGSSLSKQHEAEVVQVYVTEAPARIVQELVARAARAGWVFDASLHGLDVGQLATKRIDGTSASLTVAEEDDSHHVVLTLTRQPTE